MNKLSANLSCRVARASGLTFSLMARLRKRSSEVEVMSSEVEMARSRKRSAEGEEGAKALLMVEEGIAVEVVGMEKV